jgi:hypothetical protein
MTCLYSSIILFLNYVNYVPVPLIPLPSSMRAFFCDGEMMSGSSADTRLRGCDADVVLAPSGAHSNIEHFAAS